MIARGRCRNADAVLDYGQDFGSRGDELLVA